MSSVFKGLAGKVLLFPLQTNSSFVTLTPLNEMPCNAFTLCFRVATELPKEREIILFAYRTIDHDELNVWREKDGRVSLYLSGAGVFSCLPPLGTFRTSLCVTWDSVAGLTAFWMNGKRSTYQLYKPGHCIRPGGIFILGQDPDKCIGDFDPMQSFVGEITDVNMWDYVLSSSQIQAWYQGDKVPKGNVFDWATIDCNVNGDVKIIDDDC